MLIEHNLVEIQLDQDHSFMLSERLLHKEYNPWTGEHLHRYDEAVKLLKSEDNVLDIACGTGYGTYLLSKNTRGHVIGGDLDIEAVEFCRREWNAAAGNLSFQQMDGTKLPFEDNYFDFLTSFETIEHTTEYDAMVGELYRVVKPGGLALISTPNILINHPNGVVSNPFHTQEFTYEEFREILSKRFESFTIYGQDYIRYKGKFGIRFRSAARLENFLMYRGIRKIPLSVQNGLISALIGKNVYPGADDYELTKDLRLIKQSRTLFSICRK